MNLYLILAILLAATAIGWRLMKAGGDAVKSKIGDDNAKNAAKVADAVGNSPGSLSAVREHVRDSGQL